jgi:hypothetical protein
VVLVAVLESLVEALQNLVAVELLVKATQVEVVLVTEVAVAVQGL